MKHAVRLALAAIFLLIPATALAAPNGQESPVVTVSPPTARPGQTIQVTVSGFTAPNHVNTSACVGMLGPGQNVELGRTPAFRPRVGLVAIGANGTGQTSVMVPASFVAGRYQVVVGGCARQPDLAPLAALASTDLTVVVATPTPTRLPATGGAPGSALAGLFIVGIAAVAGGLVSRRARGNTRSEP